MLARAYLRTQDRLVVTARAFAIAGAFLGVIGILERVLGFELASFSGGTPRFDLAIGLIRVSGPYAVPEVYALALLICLAATLCWIQIAGRSVFLIGWGIAAVEIAAIGLTFFRAAWIGAVFVVFAAFGMRRARLTRAAVTAVVLGVLLLALYSQLQHVAAFSTRIHNTQNVQTRFATYDEALSIFAKSPVFGVGVNRYTSAALQLPTNADAVPYPHSSFLGLLAEQGAVGVLPLVFLLLAVTWLLRSFNRAAAEDEIDAAFGAFATGAAFAYLLMSLTLTMLPYGPTNGMFALVLGAVAGRGELDADPL
jgi:O-antigen ligase